LFGRKVIGLRKDFRQFIGNLNFRFRRGSRRLELNRDKIEEYIERKIIEKLLPPLPQGASEQKLKDYEISFNKMRDRLRDGKLDHLKDRG